MGNGTPQPARPVQLPKLHSQAAQHARDQRYAAAALDALAHGDLARARAKAEYIDNVHLYFDVIAAIDAALVPHSEDDV